jgi:23S rRNA pseudouridine1911/1915/1917 synthase
VSDQGNPNIAFTASSGGDRLDYQLSQEVDGLNRRRARELCQQGLVLVNGKPKPPGYILALNDRVQCSAEVGFERLAELRSSLPLCIVYEDTYLMVVEKPRELHSVVRRTDDTPTLADSIAAYFPPSKECSKDRREAGLVQRLDFFTSGLLLVAKNLEIWDQLHNLLINQHIEKSYLALVEGDFPQVGLEIDYPIYMPRGSNKVIVQREEGAPKGSPAYTQAKAIASIDPSFSLVRAKVKRGRRHQVRAHLASVGHPLVGDEQYGAKHGLSELSAEAGGLQSFDGFLLHAESLSFVHPTKGKLMSFCSKSPIIEALVNKDR